MRPVRPHRILARLVLAGVLAGALAGPLGAQVLSPDYALTAPSWLLAPESEVVPRMPMAAWGVLRLAAGSSSTGGGLSLEAGEKWFARAGLGRSLESDSLSLGGGYRFAGGDALSMQV